MQPTWREKDPSSQGLHNDSARGNATRGRCVSGARVQRRQGLPRTKVEKTPPVSQDRSIKQCGIGREVPADHEAQGQVNAVTTAEVESEVADVRQTTAKRRLES